MEGKTLKELDVKAGDVVRMVSNQDPRFVGLVLTIGGDGIARRYGAAGAIVALLIWFRVRK